MSCKKGLACAICMRSVTAQPGAVAERPDAHRAGNSAAGGGLRDIKLNLPLATRIRHASTPAGATGAAEPASVFGI